MEIKKLLSRIFVYLSLVAFFTMLILGYLGKYDVENSKKMTIGRYVSQKNYPKTQSNYFVLYIKNERFRLNGGRTPRGFSKNIGKFYRIKYSINQEIIIRPLFDQEITDTAAILEAGFPIEEVRKRLRNQHK